jgi:hypothetical protein
MDHDQFEQEQTRRCSRHWPMTRLLRATVSSVLSYFKIYFYHSIINNIIIIIIKYKKICNCPDSANMMCSVKGITSAASRACSSRSDDANSFNYIEIRARIFLDIFTNTNLVEIFPIFRELIL